MKNSFQVFYQEVKEKEEEEEFGYKIAGSLMTINYGGTLIRTLNSNFFCFLFFVFVFVLVKARFLLLQGPHLLDAND